jgi:spore maturation protein SpmB
LGCEKKLSLSTVKKGAFTGVKITWQLSKIIVPVYFAVTFLKHTPVINLISKQFAPVMSIFGLPGKAAVALVLGVFVNLYAAVGAMLPLSLSIKEISIISIMLSFCHNLPVETAISKKVGLSGIKVIAVRAGLAVISGIAFNLIL